MFNWVLPGWQHPRVTIPLSRSPGRHRIPAAPDRQRRASSESRQTQPGAWHAAKNTPGHPSSGGQGWHCRDSAFPGDPGEAGALREPGQHRREPLPKPAAGKGWEGAGSREWMALPCPTGWHGHSAAHPLCSGQSQPCCSFLILPHHRRLSARDAGVFPGMSSGFCLSRLQGPFQLHRELEKLAQVLPAPGRLQQRGKARPGQDVPHPQGSKARVPLPSGTRSRFPPFQQTHGSSARAGTTPGSPQRKNPKPSPAPGPLHVAEMLLGTDTPALLQS